MDLPAVGTGGLARERGARQATLMALADVLVTLGAMVAAH